MIAHLYAYGHHYLNGTGDIVLIYPKTETFSGPLPEFRFPVSNGLVLWVLPFCIEQRELLLPDGVLRNVFQKGEKQ
ncbi:hypothetical protein [Caenimonas sp. SL110]|uniref:hypothetical protein n=1 Tax=Caenimonas sp. SL110 TaxID=1450524 RepID=UPI0006533175|nr:hypothetical protein [Caenimonas sp. SL110]